MPMASIVPTDSGSRERKWKKAPEQYIGAPEPSDEWARVRALRCLNVLDTSKEPRFDKITAFLGRIFKVPIALVSLVDSQRQWFKSTHGIDVAETQRDCSFCAWTLLPANPEVLVVTNALEDTRFRESPLVQGWPHIRFYAGTPLVLSNGMRLGSLCLIDSEPRPDFSQAQCVLLTNMGELVMRELEREQMKELERNPHRSTPNGDKLTDLKRSLRAFKQGTIVVDAAREGWPILHSTEQCKDILDIDEARLAEGQRFWDVFCGRTSPLLSNLRPWEQWCGKVEASEQFSFQASCMSDQGHKQWVRVRANCGVSDRVDDYMVLVQVSFELPVRKMEQQVYFLTLQEEEVASSMSNAFSSRSLSSHDSGLFRTPYACPLANVRLSTLIDENENSRVHRAIQNGKHMAVKVVESMELGDDVRTAMSRITAVPPHPCIARIASWLCTPGLSECSPLSVEHSAPLQQLPEEEPDVWEVWMSLPLYNQGSLQELLDHENDSNVSLACPAGIALCIAQALQHLHASGMVHGNLHCNNVLLHHTADGCKVKAAVSDYGMYWLLDPPQTPALAGGAFSQINVDEDDSEAEEQYGQQAFMSPLLQGAGPGAPRRTEDDIYALGVVLDALAAGQVPGKQQRAELQPAPSWVVPAGQFSSLAAACKAEDPRARPSAAEVVEALQKLAPHGA